MAAENPVEMASEPPPKEAGETASSILASQYVTHIGGAPKDPYDEDEAEYQFLLSKPTCFVMLGKPGCGKTTLARRLAQEWKCEIVNATDVISQAIEMQTEMGLKAQEILLRGEAIPEEMAGKMIEEKINSPEVTHHGYVLDGFPSLSEDYMSVRDQLELVKNWKLKPDFVINLRMPDRDLEVRRIGLRIDPMTGDMFTKEMYNPDKAPAPVEETTGDEEGEEEEEEEEEQLTEEEGATTELAPEIVERLIRRPEDLPSHVTQHIKRYKNNMLRILEDYIADHDQQHLIELDANKSVAILFKELLTRLSCFVLRPAAVPIRLQDPEEEEVPEDVDTDELMRSLAPKEMVAPRYRWRRSRWLRYCPVALAEGNLILGKPEFAISFLDKMYVLSSAEAMGKFLKNPRPYLLPPQPRPPCKLVVTGPPLAGKTTLTHQLASKYGAKVLDMEELMKPRLEAEKKKLVEAAREEALESAVMTVKAKIKEEQELEKAAKAAPVTTTTEGEDTSKDTEAEDEEERPDGEALPADGAAVDAPTAGDAPAEETSEQEKKDDPAEDAGDSEKAPVDDATTTTTTSPTVMTAPTMEVDSNHPEVQSMVAAAVETAEKQPVNLPADIYIEVMEAAISDLEKDMRAMRPDGPLNGGWILDNFPKTREQWNAMIERGIMPDDVICLRDESENGDFLIKRWYHSDKDGIDAVIGKRKAIEEEERQKRDEEARIRAEEEKRAAEEAARQAAEEERQRKLEEGEEPAAEEAKPETEAEPEAVEQQEAAPEPEALDTSEQQTTSGSPTLQTATPEATAEAEDDKSTHKAPPPPTPEEDKMPPEGPEVAARRELRKAFETEWPGSQAVISGSSSLEPLSVEICQKDEIAKYIGRQTQDIFSEARLHMERHLQYHGWELQGMDVDEEEEDNDADEEEELDEVGEEGEEEEDPNRSLKKQLGDTSYFCPVAFKEKGVLWPGNPEVAAKYRERTYYLSSPEAREKFLTNPPDYLPKGKPFVPPALRLLLLGPKGAGKTTHGKHLARKLGLFHIQFRERLQELIIAKTKKKVGKEYEEEQQEDIPDDIGDEEEEDEEGEAGGAITGPDGVPVMPSQSEEDVEKSPQVNASASEEETKEEEELDLTEDEEAIKNYLENDDALPNELLEKIISPWWHEEPFKSAGFLIEGFPRTADEAALLGDLGLYPDAAVVLGIEDGDVIGRLLPPKLARWKERRAKVMARKQKIKDRKKKKRDAAIAKKREELTQERDAIRAERRANREAEGNDDDEEEYNSEEEEGEEEEDDIEAQLAEMFEEEEEEEEEEMETEEDATDRMRNDLEEVYDNDTNRLAAVQDKFEELLVPRIDMDAGRKPHIVRYLLGKRLRPFIQCRHSMFERVVPVSEKMALKMLQVGYKHPSRFGKWCPVKLSENDCIQPMQGPGYNTYPAIYRQFIYFLSSPAAREQFMQDPMNYLGQPTPKPVVPIRMAIIGPPKSGKTALSQRFADEYGLMRLSIGEAVRMVQEVQPNTELAKAITAHLKKGLTVSDEMSVQALEVALMDMKCQTRGYILDGYPLTKRQVDLMTERSIIPVRIIELQVNSKEIVQRAIKDRYSTERVNNLHDSPQILTIKLSAWHREIGAVREWYQTEHANCVPIQADKSKWWVWNKVTEIGKESVMQIQTYLQQVAEGNAAAIGNLCITPGEFEARLGDYEQYCPVSLAECNELVDCSVTKSLIHAVEYRGHYYKCAGERETEKFLKAPHTYVPPLAPRKLPPPELLPKRRTAQEAKALFPMPVELQGYCPVTYLDGKCRYEAIVAGEPSLVVQYKEKLYYMASEEHLQKFMRLPEKYWNLKLPHKLPPKKNPLDIYNLPMLGYLEQTVADAVIKGLTSVGNVKPKYPFLSSTRSALVYVAFHLKAYNPRSSEYVRKKYRRKLMQFEDTCSLIQYLGNNMTKRYKDPTERPIDFDFKMEKFMALKGVQPTTSYVA